MKKLTRLLVLTMTGGLLLTACGDTDNVDDIDLQPLDEDIEEDVGIMEDDPEDEMDDDLDDDMD